MCTSYFFNLVVSVSKFVESTMKPPHIVTLNNLTILETVENRLSSLII